MDPHLELWNGRQYPRTGHVSFGVFKDLSPDRWGRMLFDRWEALSAEREGRHLRELEEVDYQLGVDDRTRLGALRFRQGGAVVKMDSNPIPNSQALSKLAEFCFQIDTLGIEKHRDYATWLQAFIGPCTALGGARPKASFADDSGQLWIAKFPAKDDDYDVGAWEYLLNRLAGLAGIRVPPTAIKRLGGPYSTFCAARFDRVGHERLMYASAMTLLGHQDGDEGASYLDMAAFITDATDGELAKAELEQLFRRVIFNVLTGNRDDHLRNHGFIRDSSGWRLSPAFDMNPSPTRTIHATSLDGSSSKPSLETVLDTAELYGLTSQVASSIAAEISAVVAKWQEEARKLGVARRETQLMERAFYKA